MSEKDTFHSGDRVAVEAVQHRTPAAAATTAASRSLDRVRERYSDALRLRALPGVDRETERAGPATRPTVLWVDLRVGGPNPLLEEVLSRTCTVYRETRAGSIAKNIARVAPRFLIFDYDYPDTERLKALQDTKARHPSHPIIMLTEQHSEELAVWAFRSGAWDYLRSPVQKAELVARIEALSAITAQANHTRHRLGARSVSIPPQSRASARATKPRSTERAIAYIEAHLEEKISLDEIARHCGLSPFSFSRSFKKTHDITFQDYLIQARIERARELLANPRLSVTDVAEAAGFGDLSHFIRTFRRLVGTSPSAYRKGAARTNHR